MHHKRVETINKSLDKFFQATTVADVTPDHPLIQCAANQIYKAKKSYIEQVEIQVVLTDFIKNALVKKGAVLTDLLEENLSLTSVLKVQELTNLKSEIVGYFDSLPRNYTCVFKLPNVFSLHPFSLEVDENVVLDFTQPRQCSHLFKALLGEGYSGYYLSVIVKYSGYLSLYDYSSPYGIFKHIVGIAVGFDYFKSNPLRSALLSKGLFNTRPIHLIADSFFIDDALGDKSKVYMQYSDSVSEKLNDLEFDVEVVKDNYEVIAEQIKKVYVSFKNDESHAGKIRSALEWSFDSTFTNNQTFTFILHCIAIEALMGDSSTDITKTLSNRCAYMLAKKDKDRKYLIDEIKKLYNLRSKLVHGNQASPDKENKKITYFARDLLKQLLRKELKVLLNSDG